MILISTLSPKVHSRIWNPLIKEVRHLFTRHLSTPDSFERCQELLVSVTGTERWDFSAWGTRGFGCGITPPHAMRNPHLTTFPAASHLNLFWPVYRVKPTWVWAIRSATIPPWTPKYLLRHHDRVFHYDLRQSWATVIYHSQEKNRAILYPLHLDVSVLIPLASSRLMISSLWVWTLLIHWHFRSFVHSFIRSFRLKRLHMLNRLTD